MGAQLIKNESLKNKKHHFAAFDYSHGDLPECQITYAQRAQTVGGFVPSEAAVVVFENQPHSSRCERISKQE
jgi:hypothetical protein